MSKTIEVSDETYEKIKDQIAPSTKIPPAKQKNGMDYVICRTYSAGVFAGYLESRNGQEGTIREARRIWFWKGAASLSQLAVYGTKLPNECKFPCPVDKIELTQIIEVLYCTETAKQSITGVPIWKL